MQVCAPNAGRLACFLLGVATGAAIACFRRRRQNTRVRLMFRTKVDSPLRTPLRHSCMHQRGAKITTMHKALNEQSPKVLTGPSLSFVTFASHHKKFLQPLLKLSGEERYAGEVCETSPRCLARSRGRIKTKWYQPLSPIGICLDSFYA